MVKQHRSCGWLARAWLKTKKGRKLFKRTDLLLKGHKVFEYHTKKYRTATNPGVGPACGSVKDTPQGESVDVIWSDGAEETMEKSVLRVAPKDGENFGDYTLSKYGDKKGGAGDGCIIIFHKEITEDSDDEELKLICTQCGKKTSGQHCCPLCKRNYHTLCMISFNKSSNKMCADCYVRGAYPLAAAKWKPDVHDHDPFGRGAVAYCAFTKNFFELQQKKKAEEKNKQTEKNSPTKKRAKRKRKGTGWKRTREPALPSKMVRVLNKWFRAEFKKPPKERVASGRCPNFKK